jgi:hypothetical protein
VIGGIDHVLVAVGRDDAIPGARRFHAHDPWGNGLEVVEA